MLPLFIPLPSLFFVFIFCSKATFCRVWKRARLSPHLILTLRGALVGNKPKSIKNFFQQLDGILLFLSATPSNVYPPLEHSPLCSDSDAALFLETEYCPRGSICSRRSKATVKSVKVRGKRTTGKRSRSKQQGGDHEDEAEAVSQSGGGGGGERQCSKLSSSSSSSRRRRRSTNKKIGEKERRGTEIALPPSSSSSPSSPASFVSPGEKEGEEADVCKGKEKGWEKRGEMGRRRGLLPCLPPFLYQQDIKGLTRGRERRINDTRCRQGVGRRRWRFDALFS